MTKAYFDESSVNHLRPSFSKWPLSLLPPYFKRPQLHFDWKNEWIFNYEAYKNCMFTTHTHTHTHLHTFFILWRLCTVFKSNVKKWKLLDLHFLVVSITQNDQKLTLLLPFSQSGSETGLKSQIIGFGISGVLSDKCMLDDRLFKLS